MSRHGFETELIKLINRESMEGCSDTPDYILAAYLMRCLDAWNITQADREYWYRKPTSGGQVYRDEVVAEHEKRHPYRVVVKEPYWAIRVCPDCASSGQVTPMQDGTKSPGPSSASIDCPRCQGKGHYRTTQQ